MYKCTFCNVGVTGDQVGVHSKTERHKLLCFQNEGDFVVHAVKSAFQCRIITYRIDGPTGILDPKIYLDEAGTTVQKLLKIELETNKHIKMQMEIFCTYVIVKGVEVIRDVKPFQTKTINLDLYSDLSELYENACSALLNKCGEFQERDSGWTLEKIEYLELNINKYAPIKASSYIKLPDWILHKKACVNVKNDDNACFFWAVTSALYPVISKSSQISSYPHYEAVLNTDGIDLPVNFNGIKRFEKQNQIKVNVYGIETKNKSKQIVPLYVTSKTYDRIVHLLYFESDKRGHYCWIKNLSRLLRSSLTRSNKAIYFCDGCLQYFVSRSKLQLHREWGCQKARIELPSPMEKYLQFKNISHQLPVPFVIYADFEAILVPLNIENETKSTYSTHKHVPFSFGYYVHCNYDNSLSKYVAYRGEDCVKKFIDNIYFDVDFISRIYAKNVPPKDIAKFDTNNTICHICEQALLITDDKVIDHCHFTGQIRGVAHSRCNLQYTKPSFVPVMFHNLSAYDSHLFIKELAARGGDPIHCIPQSKEQYIAFSKRIRDITIRFVDSYKFMSTSLDKLAKNLSMDQFQILPQFFPENLRLLTRKGVFPYEYIDSWDKLDDKSLPSKQKFYSQLTQTDISDDDYVHAHEVWEKFQLNTLGEYSDLYLKTDVLLLAEVFENFRKVCLTSYKLDPCRYFTAPGLSWDAMLKETKVKLELLTEYEMLQFLQAGIRGGISQVSKRHARANNAFMTSSFDPTEDSKFIVYLDVNNLYGYAMSQHLPDGQFKWLEANEINAFDILNQRSDSDMGYILEVDLEYPRSLHDLHNDYPFCAESKTPPNGTNKKLLLSLDNKQNYVIHYMNLQQCIQNGLVCRKIHRILSFHQSPWLKSYIDLNTEKRTVATNAFEKDFYKLMNNSIFGKTIENVAKRIDVILCTNWEDIPTKTKPYYGAERYLSRPNFHSCTIFTENFVAVQMNKTKITYDKPIYVGVTVLELAKYAMYDFHYSYMIPKYGQNLQLLYTDTDSFIYEIKTHNFYEDIRCDISTKFDTSDFPQDNIFNLPLLNKKVIGLMKDENNGRIVKEFVGLRSKMYTFVLDDDYAVKKNKGISAAVVRKLNFDHYCAALDLDYVKYDTMCTFNSKKHTVYTQNKKKKVICGNDDKRYICPDGVNTLAWGHYNIA